MILRAPAKVNLYLRVLNKRPDGYHSIETVFERIALSDKIVLRSLNTDKIKIFCDNPIVPTDKTGLIYRAIDLLRARKRLSKGAEVKVFKKIPVAAGLGGGSSDAASILAGLNKMWKMSLGLSELIRLGKELGADVPFFLNNTSFAIGRERGDEIVPLEWGNTRFWHLLVCPPLEVLSKDIYDMYSTRQFRNCHCDPPRLAVGAEKQSQAKRLLHSPKGSLAMTNRNYKFFYNDLERIVIKKEPVVNKIKLAFKKLGIDALVSGSGPSVFAIFKKRKEAIKTEEMLTRRFPFVKSEGWQIFIVPTL